MRPLLLAAATLLLLASCKKDATEETPCGIKTILYYNNASATPIDSAGFHYSGGRVARVVASAREFTLAYDAGGRIVQRDFYGRSSGASTYSDRLSYNADGTLAQYVRYAPLDTWRTADSVVFRYTNGKLAQQLEYGRDGSGSIVLRHTYLYTWSGDNILSQETLGGNTLVFTYDDRPNLFRAAHAQFYLLDPEWGLLPLTLYYTALSANNISTVNTTGANYSMNFATDTKGRLSGFGYNGDLGTRVAYGCP